MACQFCSQSQTFYEYGWYLYYLFSVVQTAWVELNYNRFVKYNMYLDDTTVKMLIYNPGEQQFSVLRDGFCISQWLSTD